MNKTNPIGVDAIWINCLKFYKILDKAKLIKKHREDPENIRFVYADRSQQNVFFVYDGKSVCFIKIQNDYFHELSIGSNESGAYAKMKLTITEMKSEDSDQIGNNNDNVLLSVYKEYLKYLIEEYLPDTFGIQLGMKNAGVELIEINTNILLDNPYCQYSRVLCLLMSYLKKVLGPSFAVNENSTESNKNNSFDTLCKQNKSEKVILYNKIKEAAKQKTKSEQPSAEEQNVLRVEFKLKNPAVIKRRFKTNRLHGIDDDMITDYFHNTFLDYFVKPYIKWKETQQKKIKQIIRQTRQITERKWSLLTMEQIRNNTESKGVPFILDVEQVMEAINDIPDKNRNNSRKIKMLLKEQLAIANNEYLNHDIDKILEIFGKEEENYCMTKEMIYV